MSSHLFADSLFAHVRALADQIGPRPPGHPEEAQARTYIRRVLADLGYPEPEELPFNTIDDPVYSPLTLLGLALSGAVVAELGGRRGKFLGAALNLYAAASLWWYSGGGRQPLERLAPQHPSATLLLRIPPTGTPQRRVVLVGHTDTQRYHPVFQPHLKHLLQSIYTQSLGLMVGGGGALLARAAGIRPAALAGWACAVMQAQFLYQSLPRSARPYVAGANDNATAVACLLGLAAHLRDEPLAHTEVWLAFTGAEEVMCRGMHRLLDQYGDELRDAYFIDFEMVGSDEIAYVTRHSGLTYLNAYRPDPESLALAERTAAAHPELRIQGRELVIVEEVGTLRQRGFRGLCIAGVGPDGWLENWHLPSDVSENIKPGGIERAARFALAMLRAL
ncbi:MAG: Zn-dependent exopeptidase M28 [Oscillochloris sp.]|nr:Zn-dependent exopeptidase M28 [Oscillochloris sp.]